MKIGLVGLGRMGAGIAERLRRDGHEVVGYDQNPAVSQVPSLEALVGDLTSPRVVWLMVPAGAPTQAVIDTVTPRLTKGDILVDGGNSYYKDDQRRAQELKGRGLHYVDAGTSGGIWGLKIGYCLMVGGEEPVVKRLAPIFTTLAPEDGWAHMGGVGSGHYVKMIHNGIEYGMMQAYAEGFELMSKSDYKLNLPAIAELWMHGSVVRSWLLELAASALRDDPKLEKIKGYVEDSGEGRWTVYDAIEKDVPAMVLTSSLFTRFRSRQQESFGEKMLAALRNAFGGHAVRRA